MKTPKKAERGNLHKKTPTCTKKYHDYSTHIRKCKYKFICTWHKHTQREAHKPATALCAWTMKQNKKINKGRASTDREEEEEGGTVEGLHLQELLSLSLVPEVTSSGRTRQVRVSNTSTYTKTRKHIDTNTNTDTQCTRLSFRQITP